MKERALQVHLALFTVSLLYAATFTIAKEVMPAFLGPFAFIVIRVGTAALLFLLFQGLFIREQVHDRSDYLKLFLCSMFGVGFNMLLFFKGLSITTPINGAVLMACSPIFVLLFAALFLREKLSLPRVAGILLAASGAVLLISGKGLSFSSATLSGDIMVLVNALIYSFYLVYAKPLMLKYSPITVSKWTFLFGTLIVLPFGWQELGATQWSVIPAKIWGYITFVAIGTTFLTYLLNAWALKHASSSLVGSYIYLQPVLATCIAIFAGRDSLSVEKFIFTMLIFAGVYLASKTQK